MFSPEYFRQTSLLNGKEKLMGNLKVAGLIENMAFECIKNNIGLYAAQEQIKTTLLNVYSEISNKAVDDGLSLDDYDMTAEDLKKTLMEYNISSEYADNIVDVCMEFSDDNKIKANDIVDDKVLKKNELYIAYKKLLAENEELKKQLALLK